jgi:hypothetical protein
LRCVFAVLLGAMLSAAAVADEAVATVRELDGLATAFFTGAPPRRLAAGDELPEQTKIVTGRDASITLVFTDQTEVTLGGTTIFKIDHYRYRPATTGADDTESEFSTSILSGVLRTVTGLIAKHRPRRFSLATNVATIGVRGTHFTAEVQESSATIILLPLEDPKAPNAIEVSNAYGTVQIDEAGYGTEIPDAHSPPSPPRQMRTTENMTRILRSVNTMRRVIVPRSPIRH